MSGDDSIPTLDEVTAGWLSDMLRAAGHADAEVIGFHHIPIGTGQFSNSVRFMLEYARPRPEHPATIVGKFPSTDTMTRSMAVIVRAYAREVGFYNRLPVAAADPDAALLSRGGPGPRPGIRAVAGGHASGNPG